MVGRTSTTITTGRGIGVLGLPPVSTPNAVGTAGRSRRVRSARDESSSGRSAAKPSWLPSMHAAGAAVHDGPPGPMTPGPITVGLSSGERVPDTLYVRSTPSPAPPSGQEARLDYGHPIPGSSRSPVAAAATTAQPRRCQPVISLSIIQPGTPPKGATNLLPLRAGHQRRHHEPDRSPRREP